MPNVLRTRCFFTFNLPVVYILPENRLHRSSVILKRRNGEHYTIMSTMQKSNDESMKDKDKFIEVWDNQGLVSQHVRMSENDFPSNKSDHHMIMMLSMTEVEESDDNDDSFSIMSDYNNDEIGSTSGWDDSSRNHLPRSRTCTKSVPSFYGDDDEDEDYESIADYSEDMDFDDDDVDDVVDDISTSHVSIRTPPQDDPQAWMFRNGQSVVNHCEVTPEPPTNVTLPMISAPQMSGVQIQVHRTLRKLACSMRRSDATRTFLKRQRLQYHLHCPQSTGMTNDGEKRFKDDKDHDGIFTDDVPFAEYAAPGMGLLRGSAHEPDDTDFDIERRSVYHMIQMGLRSASAMTINSGSTSL